MDLLATLWEKLSSFYLRLYESATKRDSTTWVTHWMIGVIPCVLLGGLVHVIAGLIGARIFLIIMAFREGRDRERKIHAGVWGKKAKIDMAMDLLGPVVNDVIWTVIVING